MRERSSRGHRSSSRDRNSDRRRDKRHKSKKYKKSKKSKKYSSSSSSSSYDSRESEYRSSRRCRTRALSSESNSRKTVITSSENSRASVVPPKAIDLTDEHVKETIATIDEDKFEVKSFFSTRDREAPKKLDKVVIDLNNETVQIPKPLETQEIPKEQIFHPNFLGDAELKTEKWIRKLYNFRQRHAEV